MSGLRGLCRSRSWGGQRDLGRAFSSFAPVWPSTTMIGHPPWHPAPLTSNGDASKSATMLSHPELAIKGDLEFATGVWEYVRQPHICPKRAFSLDRRYTIYEHAQLRRAWRVIC